MILKQILDTEELLTVDEIATKLKIDPKQVYNLTRKKRHELRGEVPMPCRHIGKELRFSWHEIVEWLNKQTGETQ